MMCPFLFSARGLAASGPGLPATVPRSVLLVQTTYTLPVWVLGSTSSHRSIGVAWTASAASRVKISTCSRVKPGTTDWPFWVSGIQTPRPRLSLVGFCTPLNLAT